MPELRGKSADGANRKLRELWAKDNSGTNRKLKELWAKSADGANRKIFSGYGCKAAGYFSLTSGQTLCTISPDGMLFKSRAVIPSNPGISLPLIKFTFDAPIAFKSGEVVAVFKNASWVKDNMETDTFGFVAEAGANYYSGNPAPYATSNNISGVSMGNGDLTFTSSISQNISSFVFSMWRDQQSDINLEIPAGNIYILGKQITSIEVQNSIGY